MKMFLVSCALLLCARILSAAEVSPATKPALADCKLSGPYTHGNLTVVFDSWAGADEGEGVFDVGRGDGEEAGDCS